MMIKFDSRFSKDVGPGNYKGFKLRVTAQAGGAKIECLYSYSPDSNNWGLLFLLLSVCFSVCLLLTLTLA